MPSSGAVQLHVYGIPNCDTVRAALKWLQTREAPYTFHDFRKEGVSVDELRSWLASSHGPSLLNKRSATWRQLSAGQKQAAGSDPAPLFQQHPTLIKRPVITDGERVLAVGFSPEKLEEFV